MEGRKITVDQLDSTTRLHLSILHGTRGVCKIVEESLNPNIKFDDNASALIGEIVWRKLQEMGSDLEHFAKHAKRTTIKPPDVLLLTRRNTSLTEHLSKLVKVEERKKRKSDGTATNAEQTEALNHVEIEANTESNDCAPVIEPHLDKECQNFDDNDMDVPMVVLSDDE